MKCKVLVGWTALGFVGVTMMKTLQAFNTIPTISSYETVSNAGLRVRPGAFAASSRNSYDRSDSFASTILFASVAGAFLVSAAAAKSLYRPQTFTTVPRRQAMGSYGVAEDFQTGQAVKVKIWNGEWHPGVVTSTAPLKVKPSGWTDSHIFESVIAVASYQPASGSAAAHVPQAPKHSGTFDPSTQLGVTDPMGFFDPLGLTKQVDEAGFRHFRAAELKHGRIAMLAAVGCVVQHHIAIPGFEDVPRGLGAFETFPASPLGLFIVALASGCVEAFMWKEDENRLPGDFGNPWCPIEGFEVTDELRNKELNNGRLGMVSILGIIAGELASGRDGVEQIFGAAS